MTFISSLKTKPWRFSAGVILYLIMAMGHIVWGISQSAVVVTVFFAATAGLILFAGATGYIVVSVACFILATLDLVGVLANPLAANEDFTVIKFSVCMGYFVFFSYSQYSLLGFWMAAHGNSAPVAATPLTRTKLIAVIIVSPIFVFLFLHLFASGWLFIFLAISAMCMLATLNHAPRGQHEWRTACAFVAFVDLSIALPSYRVHEMTLAADQVATYAQAYYLENGNYPADAPIPYVWDAGDMSAISYYPFQDDPEKASVDESLFFFSRRCIYLDHGKLTIVYLD